MTRDLHGEMSDEMFIELSGDMSAFAADAAAYLTEYEEKFMVLGKNINYVRF